jgi:hypothetical protein
MRRDNQIRRHGLVLTVMIIFGNWGADRAAAEVVSEKDPARVILIAGDLANALLGLDPPPPANGRAVVAGGNNGQVLVLVLGETLAAAEQQLNDLAVTGEVEECVSEGVTCCDLTTGMYVIDAQRIGWAPPQKFESERFWLQLGEHCEPSAQEGWTGDDPPEESGADFVEIDPDVVRALAEYGVTHQFMTLAKENGEGRVLVEASSQSGELWLPPLFMHRLGFQKRSLIVLADHVEPPDPPPGDCASSISYCKKDDGDRCNKGRRHWYRWNEVKEKWCEMADNCSCS